MKQETIDIIKSMTEQGFLVIVDPEKLNDEDVAIIRVMAWKDTDNKADVTLTVEEPKPEIDLLKCDERRFRAKIEGIECEGVVSVESGEVFLCQNSINGYSANDKKGFRWSWRVHDGSPEWLNSHDVTDFELLPEPRVIFTNCVGEVFTDEDLENGIEIWWATYGVSNILSGKLFNGRAKKGLPGITTDIFRSKKSLLKYLYETCE